MIEVKWFGPYNAFISWTQPSIKEDADPPFLYFVRICIKKDKTYEIYKTVETSLKLEDFNKAHEETFPLQITVYCIGKTNDEEHMETVKSCMQIHGCRNTFEEYSKYYGNGLCGITEALDELLSEAETNKSLSVFHEKINTTYVYSREELYAAYDKCAEYLSSNSRNVDFSERISRCADQAGWERISKNYLEATNIVIPKRKKGNVGHRRYGLNGVLEGVFCSPAKYSESKCSPYGTKLMTFNAENFLNPAKFNYYFADFYCLKTTEERIHYVIIVVCKKSTADDSYCRENFKLLDPTDNPFLKAEIKKLKNKKETIEVKFGDYRPCNVYTELLLLGDISVSKADEICFMDVKKTGLMPSNTGYTHNKDCSICNATFPPDPIKTENSSHQIEQVEEIMRGIKL